MNEIFTCASFFVSFLFIAHFFRGLAGACLDPGSFSLFVH